jgi:NADH-quinone oxidoreductase subunit L
VVLGFFGTPAWPWFQSYVGGEELRADFAKLFEGGVLSLMLLSAVIVFAGLGLGWWLYGRQPIKSADETDALEKLRPDIFGLLRGKYFVDELYEATVVRFNAWWAGVCDFFDRWVWGGAVMAASWLVVGLSWLDRLFDEFVINLGFDQACTGLRRNGRWFSLVQNGQVQRYLGILGFGLAVLVLLLIWGIRAS